MQLNFITVSEPGLPGKKWLKLYNTHWEAYKTWLKSKGNEYQPDLETAQEALKKYMPEMWPTYERLCKLAKADDLSAKFLTGFQPPAYISACSNAVLTGEEIQLIRNYDYHPNLMEGTQLLSAWNGKKVIATSDCLIGAVDGMNEDGLAISLTFGGRKAVGVGFGIPFILRYVLEFCSDVNEAVAALIRIPSHMSYNVTVVDKTGAFKTVLLAPDKEPIVTDAAFTTNFQGTVDWPENAAFNKTLKRSAFLEKLLADKELTASDLTDAFLEKPLYNTMFKEGFGTLFTAIYKPAEGMAELRWPGEKVTQKFDEFQEQLILIKYNLSSNNKPQTLDFQNNSQAKYNDSPAVQLQAPVKYKWEENTVKTLVDSMTHANPAATEEQLEKLRGDLYQRGEISWEVLADFWSQNSKGYGANWKNQ